MENLLKKNQLETASNMVSKILFISLIIFYNFLPYWYMHLVSLPMGFTHWGIGVAQCKSPSVLLGSVSEWLVVGPLYTWGLIGWQHCSHITLHHTTCLFQPYFIFVPFFYTNWFWSLKMLHKKHKLRPKTQISSPGHKNYHYQKKLFLYKLINLVQNKKKSCSI